MAKKIQVAILFGGKSAEHEVSLQSAKNVIDSIDREKYQVILIAIDKKGHWYLVDPSNFLLNENDPKLIRLNRLENRVALVFREKEQQMVNLPTRRPIGPVDVVFPILHGPYAEDGTIQGLLKLADLPFVGAGVLGSAVGMDKDVAKRLLRDAGIPIARFVTFHASSFAEITFSELKEQLGLPLFVKPNTLGSSVGISKVENEKQYEAAIVTAMNYDAKILIEEFVKGREIECAVLGNDDPIASVPGEIVPQHDFYSYEAKYLDDNGALLEAPAKLPQEVVKKVQRLAVNTFKVLCCEGMARVDFFLKEDNELIVNEINTIPGFTRISMYPRLWELSGIPNTELIDRLIQLALDRYNTEKQLKTTF